MLIALLVVSAFLVCVTGITIFLLDKTLKPGGWWHAATLLWLASLLALAIFLQRGYAC